MNTFLSNPTTLNLIEVLLRQHPKQAVTLLADGTQSNVGGTHYLRNGQLVAIPSAPDFVSNPPEAAKIGQFMYVTLYVVCRSHPHSEHYQIYQTL